MNAKKTLSLSLASAMALGLLAGCGSSASSTATSTADSTASAADSTSTAATADAAGKVYYLNFKPEQDEAWQALAKTYTEEIGSDATVGGNIWVTENIPAGAKIVQTKAKK